MSISGEVSSHTPLTDREQEILACLADGLSNREIADQLVLGIETVRWYAKQIYSKLGVHNRYDATHRARALGLLPESVSDESQPVVRHNLPTRTTPFIGRQQELADIVDLLADPNLHLLTILAPGGMGKTRLALAAAERQLHHFSDGVFFVPLAPLSDPANLAPTIAKHIGCHFQTDQREPHQQLMDYLSEKHLLLVLDNFDYLLEGAPIVADILQAAPDVKVLVTSREVLGQYGETVYALTGMPLSACDDDGPQLFAESARRARPGFVVDDSNCSTVIEICRRVDGLPLGIELAAAWLRTLTLAEIADELAQGINLLETSTYSLRRVFDRSWHLLTDKEQQAFMCMSVFRGGCTRAAAEAVTGANLRVLHNLVNKSLLWRTPQGRFTVHQLLRQYASEKLEAAEKSEATCGIHTAYYAEMLRPLGPKMLGPGEQEALNAIENDFENVRLAWNRAALHRNAAAINDMVDPISGYTWARGLFPVLDDLLQLAAYHLSHNPDDQQRACLGRVQSRRTPALAGLGQHALAAELLHQSLAIAREFDNRSEMAFCLHRLGSVVPDPQQAKRYVEDSLALYDEMNDKHGLAVAHIFMVIATAELGQHEENQKHLLESLALGRETGRKSTMAVALMYLVDSYMRLGQVEEAQRAKRASLDLFRDLGNRWGLAWSLTNVATDAMDRGDLEEATQYIHESLTISREIADPSALGFALNRSGILAEINGNDAEALRLAQEALAWAERGHDFKTKLLCQQYMAWTCCVQGQFAEAAGYLAACLRGLLKIHERHELASSLPAVIWLLAAQNQPGRAVELLGLGPQTSVVMVARWDARPHWRTLLADLRCDIEAELGAEAYTAALEWGAQLDLEEVVAELLAEFGDES